MIVALSLTGFLTYSMPVYYLWIQNSNVMRFALLALIKNEFSGLEFIDSYGNKYNGEDALPPGLIPELSIAEYFSVLVGFFVGLKLLAYLILVVQENHDYISFRLTQVLESFKLSSGSDKSQFHSVHQNEETEALPTKTDDLEMHNLNS
jgi:hypothetical protein